MGTCVSTQLGLWWIPQKWVKPYLAKHPNRPLDTKKDVVVAAKERESLLGGKGHLNSPFYPNFLSLYMFIDDYEVLNFILF